MVDIWVQHMWLNPQGVPSLKPSENFKGTPIYAGAETTTEGDGAI